MAWACPRARPHLHNQIWSPEPAADLFRTARAKDPLCLPARTSSLKRKTCWVYLDSSVLFIACKILGNDSTTRDLSFSTYKMRITIQMSGTLTTEDQMIPLGRDVKSQFSRFLKSTLVHHVVESIPMNFSNSLLNAHILLTLVHWALGGALEEGRERGDPPCSLTLLALSSGQPVLF